MRTGQAHAQRVCQRAIFKHTLGDRYITYMIAQMFVVFKRFQKAVFPKPYREGCLRLPLGIPVYHNKDAHNQESVSNIDIQGILGQASHKGADSHDNCSQQSA